MLNVLFRLTPLLPLNTHIAWLMISLYNLEPMRGSLLFLRRQNLLVEAVTQSKLPEFYAYLGTPISFIRLMKLFHYGYFTLFIANLTAFIVSSPFDRPDSM